MIIRPCHPRADPRDPWGGNWPDHWAEILIVSPSRGHGVRLREQYNGIAKQGCYIAGGAAVLVLVPDQWQQQQQQQIADDWLDLHTASMHCHGSCVHAYVARAKALCSLATVTTTAAATATACVACMATGLHHYRSMTCQIQPPTQKAVPMMSSSSAGASASVRSVAAVEPAALAKVPAAVAVECSSIQLLAALRGPSSFQVLSVGSCCVA